MSALSSHEKTHDKKLTKDKAQQFSCPICQKKFKSDQQVNYHEMFHTEEERSKSVKEQKRKEEKRGRKMMKAEMRLKKEVVKDVGQKIARAENKAKTIKIDKEVKKANKIEKLKEEDKIEEDETEAKPKRAKIIEKN